MAIRRITFVLFMTSGPSTSPTSGEHDTKVVLAGTPSASCAQHLVPVASGFWLEK